MKTLENRRGTMKNHENMDTGGNRWLRVVTGALGWFWVITGNSKEEVMIFRYKQTDRRHNIYISSAAAPATSSSSLSTSLSLSSPS